MVFEYDPSKSAKNKAKHGVDFEEAKALWDDSMALEIPLGYEDEPRFAVLARMRGKH